MFFTFENLPKYPQIPQNTPPTNTPQSWLVYFAPLKGSIGGLSPFTKWFEKIFHRNFVRKVLPLEESKEIHGKKKQETCWQLLKAFEYGFKRSSNGL